MNLTLTATAPDHRTLADPIVRHVMSAGATIAEIQMYDDGIAGGSALHLRMKWPGNCRTLAILRGDLKSFGRKKGFSICAWSPDERQGSSRLAVCVTHRPEPALAVLRAIQDGRLRAASAVLIGNRTTCRSIAEQFGVDWNCIGDGSGNPDNKRLDALIDQYEVDYIVLARYMRLIPATLCRKFAGRIINLHHGLLPAFPGAQPYHDAYRHRMLTYGATVHFIVPELDAGDQIIHQDSFSVDPGTPLKEIMHFGQSEHEPSCLVEGLRRLLDREVELQFHKVVALANCSRRGNSKGAPKGEIRNGLCTMREDTPSRKPSSKCT
jgi:formyltetrahydrofolate deformylase